MTYLSQNGNVTKISYDDILLFKENLDQKMHRFSSVALTYLKIGKVFATLALLNF